MHVNAFVCPVPNDNRDAYMKHATRFRDLIMQNGCTSYMECWAEDVPEGEVTSFPKAVKLKEGESVVIGWAVWPDKATAEAGMGAVMQDPSMAEMEMPFDGQRLVYGDFTPIVTA